MARTNKNTKVKKKDEVINTDTVIVNDTENEYLGMMKNISTEDVENMKKDIEIEIADAPSVIQSTDDSEDKQVNDTTAEESDIMVSDVIINNDSENTDESVMITDTISNTIQIDKEEKIENETTTSVDEDVLSEENPGQNNADIPESSHTQDTDIVEKKEVKRRRTTREMFGCDWLGVIYDI